MMISNERARELLQAAARDIIEYNGEYAWQALRGMGFTIWEISELDAMPEYTIGGIEYDDGNFSAVFEIEGAISPIAAYKTIDAACSAWHDADDNSDAWNIPCAEFIEMQLQEMGIECTVHDWKDLTED